jgi:hypothetical protein
MRVLRNRRQPHAIAAPPEDRHADFRLELENLAIDRRGGDIEPFGRAGRSTACMATTAPIPE